MLDPQFNVLHSKQFLIPHVYTYHKNLSDDQCYYLVGHNSKKGNIICYSTRVSGLKTDSVLGMLPKKGFYIIIKLLTTGYIWVCCSRKRIYFTL